ncbi:MAG: tetratricopeptide repeat protein [Bacteroidia bacterium]|nr:tetratricopeptide repeat protein [Bacteroidia bacterium]
MLYIMFVFFLFPASFKGQNKNIDSIQTLLKKDKADINKVIHLNNLCGEFRIRGLYDSAIHYGNVALELAKQLNPPYKNELANTYNILGIIYYYQGDYLKTLEFWLKALNIYEELNDQIGMAKQIGNIAIIYNDQADYPKALDYGFKALKMAKEQGNTNHVSIWLGNIGSVYRDLGDFPKALDYYFKALKMKESLGNKAEIANTLGNIGKVYENQGYFDKALEYYFKALKIANEIGDKNGIARHLGNIGSLYTNTKKYAQAEKYLLDALAMDKEIGAMKEEMNVENFLANLFSKTNRFELALVHYKNAVALKDTIFSQENKKELVRKEMNYEFDKKEAATKAENEKQQAIAEEKNRRQEIITWSVGFGLLLVLLFAGFIFRSLRITRKQKQIIEIKSTETELQKKIIEEKNKDITDSIRYAKHIQNALLREEEHVSVHLPEHFILFMPKDIVSGDFYWGAEKNGCWYFAAVDCTGHGVPGAVMSMLGISFLNDIVSHNGLQSPAEILNRLRDKVIKELRQTGEADGNKDGMDISLARLNLKTNELEWAGANNSLYLIQNGQMGIVKADKQPIGYHPNSHPFTNHTLKLKKGDSIYLYSDGYADQFGGPKGKKFKYKQLDDLIKTYKHLPMKDQKEFLKNRFIEWKGSLEQVDDVCIFGVRL